MPAIHDTVIHEGLAWNPCLTKFMFDLKTYFKVKPHDEPSAAIHDTGPDMLTQFIFVDYFWKREINKTNKNMIKYIHVWYFSRLVFDADHESEVFFLFYTNLYTPILISHYLGLWVSPQTSVTDRIPAGGMRPPWKSVFLPVQSKEAVSRPSSGRVQAEFRPGLQ